MKAVKEIVNLYNIPWYPDQDEFLDKIFSYLYARFKYKQLILLSEDELSIDSDLFSDSPIMVKEKKSDIFCKLSKKCVTDVSKIREIYIRLNTLEESAKYLYIKLQKKNKHFESISDYKEFLNFLREYFSKYFSMHQLIIAKEPVEENVSVSEINEIKSDVRPDIKQFYSINANKMPDEVDMVRIFDKIEKSMIREMLKRLGGKKSVAAKKLNITERMIGYKIKKYKL